MTTQGLNTQPKQAWHPPPEGSPCFVEIPAQNVEKLKTFYTSLFPSWETKPAHGEATEDGTQMRHFKFSEPRGLAGAIIKMTQDGPGIEQPVARGVTVYYTVDSLELMEKRVSELGGRVIQAKTTESAYGSLMRFSDPEGNKFGCYEVRR
ncbi:hypothetical protein IFM47457_09533 [Aspergillus lentulus]|nr:hypothetical protein IFM47457_09533 [Aspergillus lentulus]